MDISFLSDISWQKTFEIIALKTGITCVVLQILEKISAWIFGIISVTLLAFVFFDSRLYSDFLLHMIFLVLNFYGWWNWSKKRTGKSEAAPVLELNLTNWMLYLAIVISVTPLWGYLMNRWFGADLAYLDAFTTVGSLVAQFLLARKYLENWIFWIVVDVVAIGVYVYKDLYFVAVLFFVYLILSIIGYVTWKKMLTANPSSL